MQKETIAQHAEDARQRCQALFNQVNGAEAELLELKIQLERARGAFQAYDQLVQNWPELMQTAGSVQNGDMTPHAPKETTSLVDTVSGKHKETK